MLSDDRNPNPGAPVLRDPVLSVLPNGDERHRLHDFVYPSLLSRAFSKCGDLRSELLHPSTKTAARAR